jgi:hypothetical protein
VPLLSQMYSSGAYSAALARIFVGDSSASAKTPLLLYTVRFPSE